MNTEELVRLITQQVLQNFSGATACAGCSGGCAGMCAQQCPDDCRVVVSAGADRLSAPLGIRQIAPDLAAMIDHTLLKPDATADQVMQLCQEARQYQFASVCLNPSWVALAARELRGSNVPVCTVVGFPLGATMPEVKAFEAQRCIADGAREVDMVINIGALKSRDYRLVAHDISAVVQAAHSCNVLVKVIIETALLSDEEKVEACALAQAAGADYVKTSTGFSGGGNWCYWKLFMDPAHVRGAAPACANFSGYGISTPPGAGEGGGHHCHGHPRDPHARIYHGGLPCA